MRHAYMIIAHHRPELLQALLDALDHERNDIFVHIDVKADASMDESRFRTEKATLSFIERMSVVWGGYSQIECAMRLLKAAVRQGEHAYYHLLTGASYPLRSQEAIHAFFEEHAGTEFVDIGDSVPYDRVRRIHLTNEMGRNNERWDPNNKLRARELSINAFQMKHKLPYTKFFHMRGKPITYKKGLAYWSITQRLAAFVVKHRRLIRWMFRFSQCADEIFMQTMAYNSPCKDRIVIDYPERSLRATTWPLEEQEALVRPNHNFAMDDFDYLMKSPAQFALKFEGPDGPELIERIRAARGI